MSERIYIGIDPKYGCLEIESGKLKRKKEHTLKRLYVVGYYEIGEKLPRYFYSPINGLDLQDDLLLAERGAADEPVGFSFAGTWPDFQRLIHRSVGNQKAI